MLAFVPGTISLTLMVIFSISLCFAPLFNILGYESSAAAGLFAGILTIFSSSTAFRKGWIESPLQRGRSASPAADFGRQLIGNLSLLLIPFFFLSLNALRVRNCDPLIGVQFWLLIPTISIFIAQSVTWIGHSISSRFGIWLAFLLVLCEFL